MGARTYLNWVLRVAFLLLTVAGGLALYVVFKPPKMAAASLLRVEATPARLERGRYLVERVAHCFGCHAQRDFTRFGAPVIRGTEGGGMGLMPLAGLPGTVVVPNITPDQETGIGNWTDGEIIRATREGVDKDGRALFPLMPYENFRQMSDEDVYSVVVYLRSLPPIKKAWPKTKLDFPVNFLVKNSPAPAGSVPEPDRGNKLVYGKYLVAIGACTKCHTPTVKGEPVPGKFLAGGFLMAFPAGAVQSYNITPDPDTGIGVWTEEYFIHKFRSYRAYGDDPPKVSPESFTLMPWLDLCHLSDEELSAIYAYLRTVPAVYNSVEKHPEDLLAAGPGSSRP